MRFIQKLQAIYLVNSNATKQDYFFSGVKDVVSDKTYVTGFP